MFQMSSVLKFSMQISIILVPVGEKKLVFVYYHTKPLTYNIHNIAHPIPRILVR